MNSLIIKREQLPKMLRFLEVGARSLREVGM